MQTYNNNKLNYDFHALNIFVTFIMLPVVGVPSVVGVSGVSAANESGLGCVGVSLRGARGEGQPRLSLDLERGVSDW